MSKIELDDNGKYWLQNSQYVVLLKRTDIKCL